MERRISGVTAHPVTIEERADGKKTISGYAAVYHRAGDPGTEYQLGEGYLERIKAGAFDAALAGSEDVISAFNHDPSKVIGRRSNGTLRLSSDAVGLRYEVDLNPEDPEHVSIAAKVKRGDVKGSSFAFSPKENGQRFHQEGKVRYRTLESLNLFDASPVTTPAYSGTTAGLRADGDATDAAAALAKWEAGQVAVRLRIMEIQSGE